MNRRQRRARRTESHASTQPEFGHHRRFLVAVQDYRAGKLGPARRSLERLLRSEPDNADALHLLGLVLNDQDEPARAAGLIERSIALKPGAAAAHANLGKALTALGRLDEALAAFDRCLELDPDNAPAHSNRGIVLLRLNRYEDAEEACRRAAIANPVSAEAHSNLGLVYKTTGRTKDALASLSRGIATNPNIPEIHYNRGVTLQQAGQPRHAIAAFDRAVELNPKLLRARWGSLMTLPVLYDSEDEIRRERDRWAAGLDLMARQLELGTPRQIDDAVKAVTDQTNFYLHYQGRNDLDLQRRFASVLSRITRAAMPDMATTPSARAIGPRGRIRVGFVSSLFREHTVCKLFAGWITGLDPDRFETHVFHTGHIEDHRTERLKKAAAQYHHLNIDTRRIAAAIRAAEVDVLIYTDVGMDPRNQLLAPLRLAPVQCVTWGHPVTTGLDSIDYFLSSELMEPEDADAHYHEKLIRLPNLSISYEPPDVSRVVIPDDPAWRFEDGPVYLCSQSLFKLLPRFDDIYPRIARDAGPCKFWFIRFMTEEVNAQFRGRLDRAFAAHGLRAADYVHLHERQDQDGFFALNLAADILLDSHLWSGGNTTLEALACHLPAVTMAGPMMRGRHTYAINRRVGLDSLNARDIDDYVDIAVRLGCDRAWRNDIVTQLGLRKSAVYNDRAAIGGLEEFLETAVRRSSEKDSSAA